MNLKIFFLVFSVILLSSCSNPSNSPSRKSLIPGDSVIIQFQETLFNDEENIRITFDSLLEDSRCPTDVVCFWEGNAKISFAFAKNDNKTTFALNTYPQFLNDTTLFDYSIFLIDVMPYPHSDSLYTQNDYSAKILVSK